MVGPSGCGSWGNADSYWVMSLTCSSVCVAGGTIPKGFVCEDECECLACEGNYK